MQNALVTLHFYFIIARLQFWSASVSPSNQIVQRNSISFAPALHQFSFQMQRINFFPSNFYLSTRSTLSHLQTYTPTHKQSIFIHTDSSIYAHYVFKAFDVNSNGAISFRVSAFQIHSMIPFSSLRRPSCPTLPIHSEQSAFESYKRVYIILWIRARAVNVRREDSPFVKYYNFLTA